MDPPPSEAKTVLTPAEVEEDKAMRSEVLASPSNETLAAVKEEQTLFSKDLTGQTSTADMLPPPESPASKKRALPEPSTEEEPSTKKAKESLPASPDSNDMSLALFPKVDKETWQGFCEIESEPAYFSVILREMGVQDVTVREVFSMSPDLLYNLPQPIYGLILLFRYREFGNEDQATVCPADVWFANQLPAQNSCGTLAMINILMNNPEVDLGEHLSQFKDFTSAMTPFQRGEAFASFDYVKKIHNSFAKEMDLLENDKHLSYKVKKRTLQQEEKKPKPASMSSSRRRNSEDSVASNNSAESFEANGHHFIAFVSVGTEVWKLDGMDAQPTSVGSFDPDAGETWLNAASDIIGALMAAGDDDYGVVAVTQSPLSPLRRKAALAINTLECVDERLDTVSQTWRSFATDAQEPTSPRLLGIEAQLPLHAVSAHVKSLINAEQLEDLLHRRSALVADLGCVAASIMEEMALEASEEEKAAYWAGNQGVVGDVGCQWVFGGEFEEVYQEMSGSA
jgi:ubiquitin carboxyl-terminal hydrolase L5